jgi:hypothetical protein
MHDVFIVQLFNSLFSLEPEGEVVRGSPPFLPELAHLVAWIPRATGVPIKPDR